MALPHGVKNLGQALPCRKSPLKPSFLLVFLRVFPDINRCATAQTGSMRIFILPLSILCVPVLFGQTTWQERCFNNPAAPYCQGRDFAVRKTPPPKDTTPKAVTNPSFHATTPARPMPSMMMTVGAMDWRFVDPFADAIVGINFAGIADSELAHSMVAQLGAKQGLTDADVKKLFEGLSGLDQIAASVRDNKFVVMLTGSVADTVPPPAEMGVKAVPVSAGVMLFGSSDAVDQAMQRINAKFPLSDMGKSAQERQAASEFWVMGSARAAGPQAMNAGIRRFFLTVWIRSNLISDLAFEFNGVPNARTLEAFKKLGGTLEGNVLHTRSAIEASELKQKFGEFVESPMGERLGALVAAARSLPARDTTAPKQAKPVIYGLEGGPKVVGQDK